MADPKVAVVLTKSQAESLEVLVAADLAGMDDVPGVLFRALEAVRRGLSKAGEASKEDPAHTCQALRESERAREELVRVNRGLVASRDGEIARRQEVESELADLQATFDLRAKADRRAIDAWSKMCNGRELLAPDHVDLVKWLVGQLDRIAALYRAYCRGEGPAEPKRALGAIGDVLAAMFSPGRPDLSVDPIAELERRATTAEELLGKERAERVALRQLVDEFKAAALLGKDSSNVTPKQVEQQMLRLRYAVVHSSGRTHTPAPSACDGCKVVAEVLREEVAKS